MIQRPPAIFVADSRGLDFLNSIATPLETAVDWISDGEGLLSWLGQAGLVRSEVLSKLRSQASGAELDKVAHQARHLREWFRGFVAAHKGRPLQAPDLRELKPLNRLLEQDERFAQVVAGNGGGSGLELRTQRRWRSPEALLLPIAEELAKLVSAQDFSDVKSCQGPACTLLFADHTRGKARRWCSMAICGNRAKQAAHRTRMARNRSFKRTS